MRVVLYLSDPVIAWLGATAGLAGIKKSQLVDRLVRYQAGQLELPEQLIFEEMLQVAADTIAVDFEAR